MERNAGSINKGKEERIAVLLDMIKKSNEFFVGNDVISAHRIHDPKQIVPELFHLPCVQYSKNGNFDEKNFPIVHPGRDRLIHSGNPDDGTLFLLECETCKKVFKITVAE